MIRLVGISVSVLLCSLLIREKNRTFAGILTIAGAVLLFAAATSEFSQVIGRLKALSESAKISDSYIRLMVKALGITVLSQFVGDLCRDNGETALAGATETVSKIAVITMLLPLFESIISIVGGLVK